MSQHWPSPLDAPPGSKRRPWIDWAPADPWPWPRAAPVRAGHDFGCRRSHRKLELVPLGPRLHIASERRAFVEAFADVAKAPARERPVLVSAALDPRYGRGAKLRAVAVSNATNSVETNHWFGSARATLKLV